MSTSAVLSHGFVDGYHGPNVAALSAQRPTSSPSGAGVDGARGDSPWDESTRQLAGETDYTPQPVESDELEHGAQVGRYSVLDPLGEGGMGIVYKAWDPQLDRTVALKVLRRGRTGHTSELELLVEAQTLAKLEHPNIVTIYDAGFTDQRVFIAMALCEGQTLRHHLAEGGLRPAEILRLFIAAGRGLSAAHKAGIVHRDFKPANVLLGKDGSVRVADFGMARLVELVIDDDSGDLSLDSSYDHERSVSTIVGTPMYMAPEQLQGRLGDHRMDQFSFCLCLYTALLGQPPFHGTTFQERRVLVPLGLGEPERELLNRSRHLPTRVRRAILRGLSVEPERRFDSMDDLLAELEERRRWPWTVSAAALGLGVGLGVLAAVQAREEPCQDPAELLDEVWSASHARRLRAAIGATRHPDAEGQQQRVQASFDDYSRSWSRSYVDACQATYVAQTQSEALFDQRMQCLQRRRSRLAASVDILGAATSPESLDLRMPVVFQLPAIDECDDVQALAATVPLPADREVRLVVDRLEARIERANAMRIAGDFQQGLDLAGSAVDEARSLDYRPILARALESLGRVQADGSAPRDAERTLREALRVASASHDQQLVARAWPSLIYALMLQDKLDAAEALAFSADLAIVQSGDELARAWLLNNLGTLYGDKEDYARAREYFQEALELKIRITSPTDFDVGISWNNLGFALTFDKQWVQANDAFDQALAIFEATVGPLHPNSGIARSGQCNVAVARKRYKEALLRCNSALGLLEASQSSPALIGRVQIKVAKSLRGLGRYEEALVVAREALARRGNDSELSQQITKWIKDTEAQARALEAERLEQPPSPDETENETKAETEEVNP